MAQKLKIARDITGVPMGAIQFPAGNSFRTTLTANVAQTTTVPAGCNIAIFSFTPQGTFVSQGDNALTLPTGSFAQDDSDLNPVARQVTPGATLNFIASATTYVQVRFQTNDVVPS